MLKYNTIMSKIAVLKYDKVLSTASCVKIQLNFVYEIRSDYVVLRMKCRPCNDSSLAQSTESHDDIMSSSYFPHMALCAITDSSHGLPRP